MQPLKNVIAAFRRELDAALQASDDNPKNIRLQADRVVLTLKLAIRESPGPEGIPELLFDVPDQSARDPQDGGPTHTVTIEFTARHVQAGQGVLEEPAGRREAQPALSAPAPLEGEAARQSVEELGSVFGAPGFDSSARAMVFREALAGMDDPQARAVLESLDLPPGSDVAPALRKSRDMICRLILSGPSKSISRGAGILRPLFRHHSAGAILRLVESVWMTQDDWLDTPPPTRTDRNSEPPRASS